MVKTKHQQVEKQTIKTYWEEYAPQTWYSDKEPLVSNGLMKLSINDIICI